MTARIQVDIWSDIACPWCYIGKRKFEAAVEEFRGQGGHIDTVYHSFLLDPSMPVDYEGSQVDYLSAHKGMPVSQVEEMSTRISGIASEVGLTYDFEHQIMTNTVLAHQLLHFAKAHGKQPEMTERLFAAYFVEGKHIGTVDALADLAAEVGLDRAEVVAALETQMYRPEFETDIAQAREYEITSVPFFVLNGKYGISGAQESSAFLDAFTQIAASEA
jgi:predicted DsbA family dithiol-disulfide isomerase